MFILGVIPARGGSKGLRRKNLRTLAGKPLVAHAIEAARASRCLSRAIVSTDDEEIAAVARAWGGDVPFLRPARLGGDDVAQIDVVRHAVFAVEAESGARVDVVVLLQPTAPLRTADDIDATVALLLESGADAAFTVSEPLHDNPHVAYTLDEGGRAHPLHPTGVAATRRQVLPRTYVRNGAVYAARRETIIGKHSFYGDDARAHVIPPERAINIDSELHLALAECLAARQRAGSPANAEALP